MGQSSRSSVIIEQEAALIPDSKSMADAAMFERVSLILYGFEFTGREDDTVEWAEGPHTLQTPRISLNNVNDDATYQKSAF